MPTWGIRLQCGPSGDTSSTGEQVGAIIEDLQEGQEGEEGGEEAECASVGVSVSVSVGDSLSVTASISEIKRSII